MGLLLAVGAVGQSTVDKLPSAADAPDKRPEICTAEPIDTPLPQWTQGSLKAELLIGSDGKVYDTRTIVTSYAEAGTAAVVKVLRTWRFKPTYLRGHYVNAKLIVEMESSKSELRIRFPGSGCKYSGFPTM